MYDFRNMSEKDVFKACLEHEVIDFGFIPMWRRKAFANFCIKHGLVYNPPTYVRNFYCVKHEYKYTILGSKVEHLPLGFLFAWFNEIFNPKQSKYVYEHDIHVRRRGTRVGFDYVTYNHGLIY